MSIDVLTALKLHVPPQSPEDVARLADTGFFPPTVVYTQPGSYVWTCQRSGRYQLIAAGAGGGGATWIGQAASPPIFRAGGSGAIARTTLDVMAGEILQIDVPRGGDVAGSMFPDLYGPRWLGPAPTARIVWPYNGARDNGEPITSLAGQHAWLFATSAPDGGQSQGGTVGNAFVHGVVQVGNAPGNSVGAINGVQSVGTSWAGPVQLTSGHGGGLNTPGGSGACLIAFISSL